MKLKRLLPYLVLNIVVSALTTLLVMFLWDRSRPVDVPLTVGQQPPAAETELAPTPTPPLPPKDAQVIEIENVYGAGDAETEMVALQRVGEGALWMAGWKLKNNAGESYTFPALTLNKGASIELYTRSGLDSALKLYWGQTKSRWASGDTVTLVDTQGTVRATYEIP